MRIHSCQVAIQMVHHGSYNRWHCISLVHRCHPSIPYHRSTRMEDRLCFSLACCREMLRGWSNHQEYIWCAHMHHHGTDPSMSMCKYSHCFCIQMRFHVVLPGPKDRCNRPYPCTTRSRTCLLPIHHHMSKCSWVAHHLALHGQCSLRQQYKW